MKRETIDFIVQSSKTASNDPTRPSISQTLIEAIDNEALAIVATDGHCLSKAIVSDPVAELIKLHGPFVVSPENIKLIKLALKSVGKFQSEFEHELVDLTPGEHKENPRCVKKLAIRIKFDSISVDLICQKYGIEYPEYQRVIPSEESGTWIEFMVNPELLLAVREALREDKRSDGIKVMVKVNADHDAKTVTAESMYPILVKKPNGIGVVMPMRN